MGRGERGIGRGTKTGRRYDLKTLRAALGTHPLAAAGDTNQAEAVADALHNVPRLLREGHKWGWTVVGFRDLFLAPLVEHYPDLEGLQEPLDETT